MAIATEREYGLFINGEIVEPQSGETRELTEPATGDPLARVALAGEADIDRAVEAAQGALAGAWGKTPANERSRLLHALADATGRESKGARRARVAQRRQGDLVGKGRAQPGCRELPLLRVRDCVDPRRDASDRRFAPVLLAEGAGRRRRPDRSLELPADDDDVEAGACAGGWLRRCAQAGSGDTADGIAHGAARERGRCARGRRQRRRRGRADDRARTSSGIRGSRRSRSPARRRRARRSCACARSRSSG